MKTKLIIILIFVEAISGLFAFDGNRKGFILGFGAGFANVSFNQEIEGFGKSDTESKGAFATDFKIGFSPDNKVEIYYSSQVAWFSIENIYGDKVSITDGVGTISISYFLSSALNTTNWAPSPYLSGGYGFSSWSTPSESNSESWTGSGFFFGGGYEFSKHYRISANIFLNNPSTSENGVTYTTNSTVLMITLSALAF